MDRKVNEDFKREMKEEANLSPFETTLYNADEDCEHDIRPSNGGGVHCTKCKGWFCY